jgi:hypothetical protein
MPDVWEYREPAERDRHPQTEATATRWQGEQYRQSEHLSRLGGPQVDAPRHQPRGPQALGYEQTGQLYAPPPQSAPPRQVSWVSAHKGLIAVYSLCAAAVIGAGVFAVATSQPGSPGSPGTVTGAAAVAGGSKSSPASGRQPGVIAATSPAPGSTVTGAAKTVRAGAKVKAMPTPDVAPSASARPSPTAIGGSASPGAPPVSGAPSHTTAVETTSPPPVLTPTPPLPTCTVTDNAPDITATVTTAEAGPNALNINIYEYGTDELAGKATLRVPGPVTAGETVSVTGSPNTLMTSCAVAGVVVTS